MKWILKKNSRVENDCCLDKTTTSPITPLPCWIWNLEFYFLFLSACTSSKESEKIDKNSSHLYKIINKHSKCSILTSSLKISQHTAPGLSCPVLLDPSFSFSKCLRQTLTFFDFWLFSIIFAYSCCLSTTYTSVVLPSLGENASSQVTLGT